MVGGLPGQYGMLHGLFDGLKLLESRFIDGQSKARSIFVEIDKAIFRFGLALENIPEQFVAYFNVDDRKIFRHG